MILDDGTRTLMDNVSVITILGSFSDILPPIAALLAIIWSLIRIYEWSRVRLFGFPAQGEFK